MVLKILRLKNCYHFNSKGTNFINDRFQSAFTSNSESVFVYKSCLLIGALTDDMLNTKHVTSAFIKSFCGKKCCFHIKFDDPFREDENFKRMTLEVC